MDAQGDQMHIQGKMAGEGSWSWPRLVKGKERQGVAPGDEDG